MNWIKIIILTLVLSSCKTFQNRNSGGGGGGGSVPTSDQMNEYLNSKLSVEIPKCSTLSIEDHLVQRKIPIIKNSGKHQWPDQYSKYVTEQYEKPYMQNFRDTKINEKDLKQIDCPGYQFATEDEKKKFWILWMSAIAKPESNFNNSECLHESDGTDSCGLLQIDYASANRWCGMYAAELGKKSFTKSDMANPEINLKCGMLIMDAQIHGGSQLTLTKSSPPKTTRGKMNYPNLVGSLFADPAFYWSVLANKGKKLEVIDWFKVHAKRQLPFCSRLDYEINLGTEKHIIQFEGNPTSKYRIGNCNLYTTENQKLCEERNKISKENDLFDEENPKGSDLLTGEKQPTKDESCDIVDDSGRNVVPPKSSHEEDVSIENNNGVSK